MTSQDKKNIQNASSETEKSVEASMGKSNIDVILQIPVSVKVVLGSATVSVSNPTEQKSRGAS
jgi:flagellar motor switch/type III secretory pathway protein FliN